MKIKENNIEVNNLPSRIFSEEILISDNTNFLSEIKKFIITLEKKMTNYKKEINVIEKKWNSFKKGNKNIYIEPEKISIKSPTTILNAPWGTGKTYFIEQMALNWNKKKLSVKCLKILL
ncbi:MAG: hypothetical protein ACRC9U_03440 [Metamycoplasmataceae bacterium]